MSTHPTIVAKFGGTSMADAEAITQSAGVALRHKASLVVVSATSGTTNNLVTLSNHIYSSEHDAATAIIEAVNASHRAIANKLGIADIVAHDLDRQLERLDMVVASLFENTPPRRKLVDAVVGFGERLSSVLLYGYLKKQNHPVELIDARDFIITDNHFGRATPDVAAIYERVQSEIVPQISAGKILITQGFIGMTPDGATTTLGRGGSDYSAALFAEALRADQLQIWTDVSGIASSDPRVVTAARRVDQLTFQEAAELATAGAKILYPKTITPCRRSNIPLFIGNTFAPDEGGTTVSRQSDKTPLVRAIALKTDQTLLTLTSPEMAHQFGYLAKIFDTLARHKVSIDQISTSEIAVTVALESQVLVDSGLIQELEKLGKVRLENGLSAISLIGNDVNTTPGFAQDIFTNVESNGDKIAVRMICQGASKHNFCFFVADEHGKHLVQKLHQEFIEKGAAKV